MLKKINRGDVVVVKLKRWKVIQISDKAKNNEVKIRLEQKKRLLPI